MPAFRCLGSRRWHQPALVVMPIANISTAEDCTRNVRMNCIIRRRQLHICIANTLHCGFTLTDINSIIVATTKGRSLRFIAFFNERFGYHRFGTIAIFIRVTVAFVAFYWLACATHYYKLIIRDYNHPLPDGISATTTNKAYIGCVIIAVSNELQTNHKSKRLNNDGSFG